MRHINTEVLVIGGGATGTGILRDLAMRGFKALLVEKRDLTHGTTGRYHGLLHSGGRYVIKDPQAARECVEENEILRKIMPHCIEDTGGFFVTTPWDDPDYADLFFSGCKEAGVPVEEISLAQMLKEEPSLNPEISRCFRVSDASADSFLAAEINVVSAMEYKAAALTYHEVTRLLVSPKTRGSDARRVTGAICHDLTKDEDVTIDADIVVNATGAWAGKIVSTAGITVQIRPGKGTMLAINHRVVNTVINRCKLPADGDIIVPAHTVSVIGTTDEQISDPDRIAIEPWEIALMINEGEKLIPGFSDMRFLRAWAGVRPLYQETQTSSTRNITRAYVLLDHAIRDGVEGLVTITSGKWTTYRKMAEVTADKVCEKLHIIRTCRTHLETLPVLEVNHQNALSHYTSAGLRSSRRLSSPSYHTPGMRLAEIENQKRFRDLVCECELATYAEIQRAILQGNAITLDDIRRDTRLGKGPCQGGFCTLRAAGILQHLRNPPIEQINTALRDFLNERWKGVRPILWGQQLRQERLDELIYRVVLNTTALPGAAGSRLGPEEYERPRSSNGIDRVSVKKHTLSSKKAYSPQRIEIIGNQARSTISHITPSLDVLIIGAGIAGLVAAWRASLGGKRVRIITKGWGSLYWGSGCIDVLGGLSSDEKKPVIELSAAVINIQKKELGHPYTLAGLNSIYESLNELKRLSIQSGYPLVGSLEKNWLLPTALGALRPTCLAPEMMVAGDLSTKKPLLIAGFTGFLDFFPALIAANLEDQNFQARSISIDPPYLRNLRNLTVTHLARCFDQPEFRAEVVQSIKSFLVRSRQLHPDLRVGFPAVLGWEKPYEVWQDLQNQLGCEVFEIAGLPPSLPGMRIHQMLVRAIEKNGGNLLEGMQVTHAEVKEDKVIAVWSEAAAREKSHIANHYILATGGILGGGVSANPYGELEEKIFHLPMQSPPKQSGWFESSFLHPNGHRIFRSGVCTDKQLHPVDQADNVILKNLSVIGGALGGYDPILERSLEGVALATGFYVGERLAER